MQEGEKEDEDDVEVEGKGDLNVSGFTLYYIFDRLP